MFNCIPVEPYPSKFHPNHCFENDPSYHFPSIFTRYFFRESMWEDSDEDPTGIFFSLVSAIRSPFPSKCPQESGSRWATGAREFRRSPAQSYQKEVDRISLFLEPGTTFFIPIQTIMEESGG